MPVGASHQEPARSETVGGIPFNWRSPDQIAVDRSFARIMPTLSLTLAVRTAPCGWLRGLPGYPDNPPLVSRGDHGCSCAGLLGLGCLPGRNGCGRVSAHSLGAVSWLRLVQGTWLATNCSLRTKNGRSVRYSRQTKGAHCPTKETSSLPSNRSNQPGTQRTETTTVWLKRR